jgi:hypothetical protein
MLTYVIKIFIIKWKLDLDKKEEICDIGGKLHSSLTFALSSRKASVYVQDTMQGQDLVCHVTKDKIPFRSGSLTSGILAVVKSSAGWGLSVNAQYCGQTIHVRILPAALRLCEQQILEIMMRHFIKTYPHTLNNL